MEKVEQYIKEHTKETSSPIIDWDGKIAIYQPWLTPNDARKAVEIAREEMIKKVCKYLEPKIWAMNMGDQKFTDEFIEDFKQAMKDET